MDSYVDEETLSIFRDILDRTLGSIDGIEAQRYRVDNSENREKILDLEHRQFLKTNREQTTYRLGPVALWVCNNEASKALFTDMNQIVEHLKKICRKSPGKPVLLADIADNLGFTRERMEECAWYIQPIISVGITIEHLKDKGAKIFAAECLLSVGKLEDTIEGWLPQWFPEAFKKTSHKSHGMTEVHALKREEILSAALSVVTQFPQDCQFSSGGFSGAKIAKQIYDKAPLWWPESSDPPLSTKKMEEIINKALKINKK